MKNRHQFRPDAVGTLEDRIVLSKASALPGLVAASASQGLKIGFLGDSTTDEFRFYPPDRSQARNWVEILSATQKVNLGAFHATKPKGNVPQGFANNWAQSGATTNQVVADQLPGLANQVRTGKVNTAAVFAGGNDFLNVLQQYDLAPQPAAATNVTVNMVEANAENNMTTVVQTLMLANPNSHVVLFTLPDVTQLPAVQAEYQVKGPSPIVGQVSTAIATYNAHIELLASGNSRISIVDLASQFSSLRAQAAATGSLNLDDTTMNFTTAGDDYHHLFLADGVHLGTIGQGIIANDFLQAVDTQINAGLKPLSAAQVVRIAKQLPPR